MEIQVIHIILLIIICIWVYYSVKNLIRIYKNNNTQIEIETIFFLVAIIVGGGLYLVNNINWSFLQIPIFKI